MDLSKFNNLYLLLDSLKISNTDLEKISNKDNLVFDLARVVIDSLDKSTYKIIKKCHDKVKGLNNKWSNVYYIA